MISSSRPRMNRRCRAQRGVPGECRRGMREFWEPRPGQNALLLYVASPVVSLCACALRWPPALCSINVCQPLINPAVWSQTNPLNDLLDSLLVTLHFQECLDLCQRKVLAVSKGHQFIECTQEFEGIPKNLPLIEALADAGGHLCEEM